MKWRSKDANLMDALVDNLLEGMIDTRDKPKVQKSSCGSGTVQVVPHDQP